MADSNWLYTAWVCLCQRQGETGCALLQWVEIRGKADILHHVPSHTFPHWSGLFKSGCQWCLTASLYFCLDLKELHPPLDTQTHWLLSFVESSQHVLGSVFLLLVDNSQSKMLLYLAAPLLLLLQPSLSSPVPLTTASRSPASRGKPSQREPPADSNATTLAVGEPCGVYTLSCNHGLRCAPPEEEPRPLRALLEGRGVCTPAFSASPTDEVQTVGESHTLCLEAGG